MDDSFAVLRRPQAENDVIPSRLVPPSIVRSLGFDGRTSRLARSFRGAPIYVVLSSELACTYSPYHPVGNCWPIRTAKEGLAFASSVCGLGTRKGEMVLYGIVPDGVDKVIVPRSDGRGSTVRVVGNVFVAPTSSDPPLPQRLFLVEGNRRQTRPTGIPADVARAGCAAGAS